MSASTSRPDENGTPVNPLQIERRLRTRSRPTPDVTAPPPDAALPLDALFDEAPLGMLIADSSGRLTRVNAALCQATGYSRRHLLRLTLADLIHPEDRQTHDVRFPDGADGTFTHSSTRQRWVRGDGRELVVGFTASAVGGAGRRQLFGIVDDLTDRRPAEGGFPVQAAHDPLTGLADPATVTGRVALCLRTGRPAVLMRVQLDDLYRCRDVFGPGVADDLIRMAARRLTDNVRPGDTVGRGGPDHFVILCPELRAPRSPGEADLDDASDAVVERLRAALAAPYRLGGIVHHVPARIVAVVTRPGMSAAETLAELAAGLRDDRPTPDRGTPHDFSAAPALLGTAAATRHVAVENELLRALREDELVMFGQPILTVATGRVGAVEMLLRWRHPTRGLLGPGDFLDVAEASPLMAQIGRRVLQESCRIAAGWPTTAAGLAPSVFVNVSGRQLESGRLPDHVTEALHDSGLPSDRLVLELTETCAPLLGARVVTDLAALRATGVRLAVDDIGTGYSTLARLTELPIDILKIDRTFVAGLGKQESADAVVRAIMHISRTLGLPVVAEGIETVAQAAAAAAHGCDLAQGFLYGRPCSEQDLVARLDPDVSG